jgi:xanthine/uracil permease
MQSPWLKAIALAAAIVIVFGIVVVAGLRLLPSPHTDSDYLVVGSVATFVALGVLFLALITTWIKTPNVFFKRREKPPED